MAKGEKGWPKKLQKGRFTQYCKEQGFDGPCKECAVKALKSKDPSVRGEAAFYLNTLKKASLADHVRYLAAAETYEDLDETDKKVLEELGISPSEIKKVITNKSGSHAVMLKDGLSSPLKMKVEGKVVIVSGQNVMVTL